MVNSLKKAFGILEVIKDLDNKAKLKDISAGIGQKAPTVHNILKTFIEIGYVEKKNEEYSISRKIIDMFLPLFNSDLLLKCALPYMNQLSVKINENVVFAVAKNSKRSVLKEVQADNTIIVNPNIFPTDDFYATSTGRILFCYMDDKDQNEYIKKRGLPGEVWDKINTLDNLKKEISKINKNGYAEYIYQDNNIHSYAMPVYNKEKKVIASLGTYFPGQRKERKKKEIIIKSIKETCENIKERYLGEI